MNSLLVQNNNNQKIIVVGGSGGNSLAWSIGGKTFTGLGTSIFSTCYTIYYSSLWVSGGQGGNTLAWSNDGKTWNGSGTTTFTTQCNIVIYLPSNNIWVAGGQGGNTLAWSNDGKTWTGLGSTTFTNYCMGLAWSESLGLCVAGGSGSGNTLAWSIDGKNWNGLGLTTFTTQCNDICWNGSIFVATGSGTGNALAKSTNGNTWTGLGNSVISSGSGVCWNGSIFVAGGQGTNTLAWSNDGNTWTGTGNVVISGNCQKVRWTGYLFIAPAINSANTLSWSTNGKAFFGLGTNILSSSICVASNNSTIKLPNMIVSAGTGATGLAYSLNGGMTWTGVTASLLTTAGLTVAYNGSLTNPLWIAGGQGPTYNMVYSIDGINWTGIASTFSTSCRSIVYSSQLGRWIAVGQGTNTIMYSTTGISGWTAASLNAFSGNGGNSVVWNGSMFLALGIGNIYDLATSTDGINWTGQKVFQGGSGYGGYTAYWNGSIWIIGGSTNLINCMYYSTNSLGTSWLQVNNTNPLFTTCYSITWNGSIYVGVGSPASNGITNSIAYSNDGTTWIGITGNTIFATTGYSVIWNGSSFLASGQDATDYYAYSITGYNGWTVIGKGAFTTSVNSLCWNKIAPDNVIVAGGQGTNTLAYSNDGQNWTDLGVSIFSTACHSIVHNGVLWVAAGKTTNTLAYSYNGINWTGIVAASAFLTQGYASAYANELGIWVAVGEGTNSIMWSTNGIAWTGITAKTVFSLYGYSIAWNGTIFVAVGSATNTIAYSYDGKIWTGILAANAFSAVGYGLCWNGSIWVAGGNSTTFTILTSINGTSWTGVNNSLTLMASCFSIAWNGSMFVAVGLPGTHAIAYSTNGTTWIGVTGTTIFSVAGYGVIWNSKLSMWLATGNGTVNTIAYSYDGINWTGLGKSVFSTNGWRLFSNITPTIPQLTYTAPTTIDPITPFFVAGGQSGNTLAYSVDCITWTGLGALTFTTACNQIAYNGSSIYVAVGQGANTIAYSSDGLFWNGIVSTPFSSIGNSIAYSPTINRWVAAGSGGNTLAWSSDGISWTGLLTSTFTSYGSCVIWNDSLSLFLAGGNGGNTIAYSSDGYSWTGLGTSVFTTNCNAFSYTGSIIVAGGSGGNTLARSTSNPPSFSAVTNSTIYISTSCKGLGWNGTIFVASGQGTNGANSLATSTNGSTWTSVTSPFNSVGSMSNNIIWNGLYWSLTGKSTGNTLAYSVNGSTWYGQGISIFSAQGFGICSNGVTATTNNVSTILLTTAASTNTFAYSFDAKNWIGLSITDISNGFHVAYNGSMWIVGSYNSTGNVIFYSTNLTSWTPIISSIFTSFPNVAWSPTLKIWVGTNYTPTNSFAWSTDGINWTLSKTMITFAASNGPFAVEWIPILQVFIAGGYTRITAWSANGKTWNSITQAGIRQLRGISASESIFVAVGGDLDKNFEYSYDGITWTTNNAANALLSTNQNISGLDYNGSTFVACGNNLGAGGVILTSPDGITWTIVNSALFTSSCNYVKWINSLSLWVVIGSGTTNFIATSPSITGNIWFGQGPNTFSNTTLTRKLAYNGILSTYDTSKKTMIVAVGGGAGTVNTIAYSFDGLKWNGLGKSIFSTTGYVVAYNNKLWVSGGTGTNSLAHSYNGINWIGSGSFFGSCRGITYSAKLNIWVACGTGGSSSIAWSQNGISGWTAATNSFSGNGGYAISCNSTILLAVGLSSNSIHVATSSDGKTWSDQANVFVGGASYGGYAVLWDGTKWIIGGKSSGTTSIRYTTNSLGIEWGNVDNSSSILSTVMGIAWNGSIYVAGGNSTSNVAGIAYSSNGTSWTSASGITSIFSSGVYGITWTGTIFVASGGLGNSSAYSFASSTDGITWTGVGQNMFTGSIGGCSLGWNGI